MIGTTGRGIGPCYTDKVARDGIQVAELLHKEHFKEKLKKTVEEKNRLFVDLYEDEVTQPACWLKMCRRLIAGGRDGNSHDSVTGGLAFVVIQASYVSGSSTTTVDLIPP